jgi:hypothetical protein
MKLSTTPFLVTCNLSGATLDAFTTKEDALKFAVEKSLEGSTSVWFKPTGQRKVLPHAKAKKVF